MDEAQRAIPHGTGGSCLELSRETEFSPAGSLLATVEEYGTLGAAVVNGAGLSEGTFNAMVRPHVAVPETEGRALARGLGWVIVSNLSAGEDALAHGGSDPGIRTFVVLLPKTKRGLVALTNGDNGVEVYRRILLASLDVGDELVHRLHL